MTMRQEELYTVADIFIPSFRERYYEYLETGEFQHNVNPFLPPENFVHKLTGDNMDL